MISSRKESGDCIEIEWIECIYFFEKKVIGMRDFV